jgi:predicted nuclease of restriction endonuclease-like (RecB) superfamily
MPGKPEGADKMPPNHDAVAHTESLDAVYASIAQILTEARATAYRAVNSAMVQAYWHIGRLIVEEEQKGKPRAEYGAGLITALSKRLTADFGKGFTETNLKYMRLFYLCFQNRHALRDELTWTHYRLLLKVEKPEAREFYLDESVRSNWSTRELERQISSLYYERLLLSRGRQTVLDATAQSHLARAAQDLIKDPYVLEFLGVRENDLVQERQLEQSLMDKLQEFLLELGTGFAFVARQRRITIEDDHFYIDLVFYNYLLRCFVLIDLKLGKLTHADIGQMDFYVRYFEQEVKQDLDNPTIGLILCSDRSDAMVRYTLLADSQQIFASRYRLHLPTEEELARELRTEREQIEQEQRLLNLDRDD